MKGTYTTFMKLLKVRWQIGVKIKQPYYLKCQTVDSEMPLPGKVAVTKPGDLGPIPRIHKVEVVLTPTNGLISTCIP